ncbi:alpha beta hydrolase fold protein [Mycena metata]|uniref:Alpha beta hydrolase fold protein n=1 Tax=Mycena metata TaxID=1033252 RepID=A0AAD7NHN6_9AGAR|nr:alpha beta hydrolase fold protein [Mycena metata]
MPSSNQFYEHGKFDVAGGTLDNAITAFRTYGDPSKPCIISSTAIGGKLEVFDVAMIGKGRALDPTKYFIVAFGLFGGGESSSPSTTPSPREGPNFPRVTYQDNVRAQHTVLTKHLGIKRVHCVVGFSMAGQWAYHWPYLYPEIVERFAVLCGSARTSHQNYCMLEGSKNALLASEDFRSGRYDSPPSKGLSAFARAYSAWPYSAQWFREERYKEDGKYNTVEQFLADHWDKGFVAGWDANDIITLIKTWQSADIAEGGNLAEALGKITAKGRIIPSRTDMLFNVEDSEEEVRHLPNARIAIIESIHGHTAGWDGNPTDAAFVDEQLKELLAS